MHLKSTGINAEYQTILCQAHAQLRRSYFELPMKAPRQSCWASHLNGWLSIPNVVRSQCHEEGQLFVVGGTSWNVGYDKDDKHDKKRYLDGWQAGQGHWVVGWESAKWP